MRRKNLTMPVGIRLTGDDSTCGCPDNIGTSGLKGLRSVLLEEGELIDVDLRTRETGARRLGHVLRIIRTAE